MAAIRRLARDPRYPTIKGSAGGGWTQTKRGWIDPLPAPRIQPVAAHGVEGCPL